MRHTELKPNLVVVARGEPATILNVLPDAKVEVQISDSRRSLIVDVEELKFFPSSVNSSDDNGHECQPLPCDEDISLEAIKIASERAYAIDQYLSGKINIRRAMDIANTKKTAFYKLIEKYDETIGPSSLYPKKSGVEKFTKIMSSELEEIIAAAIEKHYKGKSASYKKVWEEVRAQCTKLKKPMPSESTVNRRILEMGEKVLYRLKNGAEAANQKFGAKPGQLEKSYPLEMVQIDHTLVDCILVDEESREPLFRPWLTLVIDIYTRVILGYYIAYHAPSILTVSCAITHAVLPKNRYLQNLGCTNIKHPFFGVPEILHMDNASEFRTPKLQRACALHNITPAWRPVGKKHYGGHIERLIGTMMNSKVHFLPGATMSNIIKKGDYDSKKASSLTIEEFTKWFAGEVEIYNYSVHSSLKCSPADKWNKAFLSSTLGVKQKLITDPFKFRLDFMPEARRVISTKGVELNNYFYWTPALRHHVGLKNVIIKYDPFALHMVWAKIDNEYMELPFSDATKDSLSYEEYLIAQSHALRTRTKEMPDNVVAIRDENEEAVDESIKITKKTRKQLKAAKAYSKHVLDQHFTPDEHKSKAVAKSKIDFSKSPVIFDSEDV
jgi:putative transposase